MYAKNGLRLLYKTITQTGTDNNTTEKDLASYTLPANTFKNPGDKLFIRAIIDTDGGANAADVIRLYIAGTEVKATNLLIAGNTYTFQAEITKTGSTTAAGNYYLWSEQPETPPTTGFAGTSWDATTNQVIKVTGQNSVALLNALVLIYFEVYLYTSNA